VGESMVAMRWVGGEEDGGDDGWELGGAMWGGVFDDGEDGGGGKGSVGRVDGVRLYTSRECGLDAADSDVQYSRIGCTVERGACSLQMQSAAQHSLLMQCTVPVG